MNKECEGEVIVDRVSKPDYSDMGKRGKGEKLSIAYLNCERCSFYPQGFEVESVEIAKSKAQEMCPMNNKEYEI